MILPKGAGADGENFGGGDNQEAEDQASDVK